MYVGRCLAVRSSCFCTAREGGCVVPLPRRERLQLPADRGLQSCQVMLLVGKRHVWSCGLSLRGTFTMAPLVHILSSCAAGAHSQTHQILLVLCCAAADWFCPVACTAYPLTATCCRGQKARSCLSCGGVCRCDEACVWGSSSKLPCGMRLQLQGALDGPLGAAASAAWVCLLGVWCVGAPLRASCAQIQCSRPDGECTHRREQGHMVQSCSMRQCLAHVPRSSGDPSAQRQGLCNPADP
jgi:hypothetical protein